MFCRSRFMLFYLLLSIQASLEVGTYIYIYIHYIPTGNITLRALSGLTLWPNYRIFKVSHLFLFEFIKSYWDIPRKEEQQKKKNHVHPGRFWVSPRTKTPASLWASIGAVPASTCHSLSLKHLLLSTVRVGIQFKQLYSCLVISRGDPQFL